MSHINDYRTDPASCGRSAWFVGVLLLFVYAVFAITLYMGRHQCRRVDYFVTVFGGLLGRLHLKEPVQHAIILARRGWRPSMLTEQAHALVDQFAKALELVGVAIILGGILLATVTFLRDGSRTGDWRSAYPGYRSDIGRGILLGLELLVGADIISTITAPLTFESVGLLAAIVGIRTFLSFSLETEIEGCWPWQRATKDVERSVIETNR